MKLRRLFDSGHGRCSKHGASSGMTDDLDQTTEAIAEVVYYSLNYIPRQGLPQ